MQTNYDLSHLTNTEAQPRSDLKPDTWSNLSTEGVWYEIRSITTANTPCLTFVNQMLDIHLLYSRGQQRVKYEQKYTAEERGTCWLDYSNLSWQTGISLALSHTFVLTDVDLSWLVRLSASVYLSLRCHCLCRLWPAAGSASTRSRHLWRPRAAADQRFLPVDGETVGLSAFRVTEYFHVRGLDVL